MRHRHAVHDTAQLLPVPIHDPDSAGLAAIHISLRIFLHPVGHTKLVAAQVGNHRAEAGRGGGRCFDHCVGARADRRVQGAEVGGFCGGAAAQCHGQGAAADVAGAVLGGDGATGGVGKFNG